MDPDHQLPSQAVVEIEIALGELLDKEEEILPGIRDDLLIGAVERRDGRHLGTAVMHGEGEIIGGDGGEIHFTALIATLRMAEMDDLIEWQPTEGIGVPVFDDLISL